MRQHSTYIGRFAPSPTGPLHIGSLIAALASYLDAKFHRGQWLVRMEDLDPPREQPGAAEAILASIQDHGLYWDGSVLWQSTRIDAYTEALQTLLERELAFYCRCSRKDLAPYGGVYPGTCRDKGLNSEDAAVRCRVPPGEIEFEDGIQGRTGFRLDQLCGDFIVRRRDGLYAYQLAVCVDDHQQAITHVLRGSDLLDSTPRQILLQQQLGLPSPDYLHIPVITNADGQKLSKQSFAPAIDAVAARQNLLFALRFLGQEIPSYYVDLEPAQLLLEATGRWRREAIPRVREQYCEI